MLYKHVLESHGDTQINVLFLMFLHCILDKSNFLLLLSRNMVTKRIRSEYMKKFKDPKWETYAKCYEDLVSYRLSRRMLEQTHNPWFWDECGSDTESSGKCTPQEKTNEYRQTQTEKETGVLEEHGAEEAREPDTSHIRGRFMSKQ